MPHDWDKYSDSKSFDIADFTRDQQFNPPSGKLPRFALKYFNRLIQISRETIDRVERNIFLCVIDDKPLSASDDRYLQALKRLYDEHR